MIARLILVLSTVLAVWGCTSGPSRKEQEAFWRSFSVDYSKVEPDRGQDPRLP
jgi:hypothetical protein